jgi:hypothetical protein
MSDLETSDLVCRSRRERLSNVEELRLGRLLQGSEEARFQAAVLDEVERDSAVQSGDDALVARMASRALGRVARPSRHRIRAHALQFAAAALMFGAASAALGWSGALKSWAPAPTAAVTPARAPEESPGPLGARRATSSVSRELAPALAPAPSASVVPQAFSAVVPSPAELLSRANLARRNGRAAEARRLYGSLVSSHPGAREAPLAHLALGKLLESAEPAQAMNHFNALAQGGGGLRAEGLWGQAECARRLGRQAAEARALEALVREFPASPYAEAARGRLRDESR